MQAQTTETPVAPVQSAGVVPTEPAVISTTKAQELPGQPVPVPTAAKLADAPIESALPNVVATPQVKAEAVEAVKKEEAEEAGKDDEPEPEDAQDAAEEKKDESVDADEATDAGAIGVADASSTEATEATE